MRIKVGWLLLATLPGISFAGQGIFLNVNNFTKDDVYLEVESEKDWKVGDLGGGGTIPACSSQRLYTEVNGLITKSAWFKGRISTGFGEDAVDGTYGLYYGEFAYSNEYPGWYSSVAAYGVSRDGMSGKFPAWADQLLVEGKIARVDGLWSNGVVVNYVYNDGRNQDLASLTILPKRGESECAVTTKTFDFMMMDRFARAVKNHPRDFKIISGPHRDIKKAIDRGLVNTGYTFISDLPKLPFLQKPFFSADNDKTIIEQVGDGDYDVAGNKIPENMRDTWTTGRYCATGVDPQTFNSPSFQKSFTEKTTTTLKNAWGVDVGFKGSITADVTIAKSTFEKSITFKYSGEYTKADEFSETFTLTLPSQSITVQPGKCKRLTYSLSHAKLYADVNVDYEINPKEPFLMSIYSGVSNSAPYVVHKEYKVAGNLIDLLKSPDDGYLPPQFVIVNDADKKKSPHVYLRGKAELNSEYGWSATARVEDANP